MSVVLKLTSWAQAPLRQAQGWRATVAEGRHRRSASGDPAGGHVFGVACFWSCQAASLAKPLRGASCYSPRANEESTIRFPGEANSLDMSKDVKVDFSVEQTS